MFSILLFTFFPLFLLFSYSYYEKDDFEIQEEATPIRQGDTITGLRYVITIPESADSSSISFSSWIIDSVLHYKDVHSIDSFFIEVVIDNHSSCPYVFDRIALVSLDNTWIEDISYEKREKSIVLSFTKDFFLQYGTNSKIQIALVS